MRELLVPFGYCLSAFLISWITSDLFNELRELQEHDLGAGDIAVYYLVRSPEFLVVVLPIALLLALLYALTQHARHHEITAIRGAGVSLWRLALPYFGVGLAASLGLLALNELCVPYSADAAERLKNTRQQNEQQLAERHLIRNFGFTNTRDGRRWQMGLFNLQTDEMSRVQVDWTPSDGTPRWLFAERAAHTNGVWTFYGVREYRETNATLVPGLQTNELALAELRETPDEIRSEIKVRERSRSRRVRRAEIPLADLLDYLRLHPQLSAGERGWVHTQLHGRLAAPWTCLVVVVIALPFGAASGRRNVFVGVASSIFICFAFFVVMQLGLALGSGGYVPAWVGAWFPNVSFALAGVWLTARVR